MNQQKQLIKLLEIALKAENSEKVKEQSIKDALEILKRNKDFLSPKRRRYFISELIRAWTLMKSAEKLRDFFEDFFDGIFDT